MLFCPIRGFLASRRKQDDLSQSEELRRIEVVKLLLESGYSKEHIDARTVLVDVARGRRSSLCADVVVYDRPVDAARRQGSVARRRQCMRVVARIRRDRGDPQLTKEGQLHPALTLISRSDCVGVYWDDVSPCVLVKQARGTAVHILEQPVSCLKGLHEGDPGTAAEGVPDPCGLRHRDLRPAPDLVRLFGRMDEILEQAGVMRDGRNALAAKLLLMKIRDEQRAHNGNLPLVIQALGVCELADPHMQAQWQGLLADALRVHGHLLPGWVEPGLDGPAGALAEISRLLAPLSILDAPAQVLQDFVLHFSRCLYKVDLGQYFTPPEVLDLVMQILNPRSGERLLDPACGAADFLVAAARLRDGEGARGTQLRGIDPVESSVGLSRLNLLLHSARAGDVRAGDSLRELPGLSGAYALAVCNPPFGVRMLETRPEVLGQFALATEVATCAGRAARPQELGLLFVEVCLRAVQPGGRVGVILPNGYLGNRSPRYVAFRRWLLCQARIAAVIGFPRFTFKRSGTDVSASAVILERRARPLADPAHARDEAVHFDLLEKIGWDLQGTPSARQFRRDPRDGSLLRGPGGEPILDADFDRVLAQLRRSQVAQAFPWMGEGHAEDGQTSSPREAGVPISLISERQDLCLDPKRWCPKHVRVVAVVKAVSHLRIGEVVRPVARPFRVRPEVCYRYVEIEKILESFGTYIPEVCPGWALPRRARLCAAPRDIFIANIWSSAGKWMIAGRDAQDGQLLVTNGCSQFELIPGREALLPDLVFGLCSEAFKVQMRARASGSDGLSWITPEDITAIVLPRQSASSAARATIERRLEEAYCGHLHLPTLVSEELAQIAPAADIPLRSSHTAQV